MHVKQAQAQALGSHIYRSAFLSYLTHVSLQAHVTARGVLTLTAEILVRRLRCATPVKL